MARAWELSAIHRSEPAMELRIPENNEAMYYRRWAKRVKAAGGGYSDLRGNKYVRTWRVPIRRDTRELLDEMVPVAKTIVLRISGWDSLPAWACVYERQMHNNLNGYMASSVTDVLQLLKRRIRKRGAGRDLVQSIRDQRARSVKANAEARKRREDYAQSILRLVRVQERAGATDSEIIEAMLDKGLMPSLQSQLERSK